MSKLSAGLKKLSINGVKNKLGGGSKIFGGREDSGIFGTGQFRSKENEIDSSAFKNENGRLRQKEFSNALKQSGNRTGPTMEAAKIDQESSNQWQSRQNKLADTLEAQMEGRGGPSLAEMQQQRGLNQSLANANAQAASMRGVNPAMALRQTQNAAMNAQQQNVGDAAMLRASEQQAAREQFGNLSTNARGQSIDLAKSQAELQQGAAANNQRSTLEQRGMNDAQDRFLREGQMKMDENDRQAKISREGLKSQQSVGYNQVNAGAYQAAAQNRAGMIGGLGQGIAGILSMTSDEDAKTDIKPIDSSATPELKVDKPAEKEHFAEGEKSTEQSWTKYQNKNDESKSGTPHEAAGKGISAAGGAIAKAMSSSAPAAGAAAPAAAAAAPAASAAAPAALQSLAAAAPLLAAASDEKSKTKKMGAGKDGKGFLESLKAYTFKYKDPAQNGEGEHIGIMAQDLEKTPMGASMVMDTPEGKMVHAGKAAGAALATSSMLDDRLSALEKAFASRKKARA